jgi:hypothetical protein
MEKALVISKFPKFYISKSLIYYVVKKYEEKSDIENDYDIIQFKKFFFCKT